MTHVAYSQPQSAAAAIGFIVPMTITKAAMPRSAAASSPASHTHWRRAGLLMRWK